MLTSTYQACDRPSSRFLARAFPFDEPPSTSTRSGETGGGSRSAGCSAGSSRRPCPARDPRSGRGDDARRPRRRPRRRPCRAGGRPDRPPREALTCPRPGQDVAGVPGNGADQAWANAVANQRGRRSASISRSRVVDGSFRSWSTRSMSSSPAPRAKLGTSGAVRPSAIGACATRGVGASSPTCTCSRRSVARHPARGERRVRPCVEDVLEVGLADGKRGLISPSRSTCQLEFRDVPGASPDPFRRATGGRCPLRHPGERDRGSRHAGGGDALDRAVKRRYICRRPTWGTTVQVSAYDDLSSLPSSGARRC